MSPTLSPELDDALHLIARQAQELTLASGAAIALTAPETAQRPSDEMTCRASAGDDAPSVGARLHVGSGFSGECVREGKLLRCDDSEIDGRVDRDSCRTLGIRSMVAVPVKHRDSVLGIIEVFSPHTKAFTEADITELEGLAAKVSSVVERAQPAIEKLEETVEPQATAVPNLLLEHRSTGAIFFGNLLDLLLGRTVPVVETTSKPDNSWNHVFVPTAIPWKQLSQSALWHLVFIALIWNLSQGWRTSEEILERKAHTTLTYTPSFPTSGSFRAPVHTMAKVHAPAAPRPAMAVHTANVQPQATTPPAVKLSTGAHLALASWNPTSRPVLAAASAPRETSLASRRRASLLEASVVAPAPQIAGIPGPRAGASLNSLVIAPSPTIDSPLRSYGNASMGQAKVVAPAPALPSRDNTALSGGVSLAGGSVVAPPPGAPTRDPSDHRGISLGTGTVVGPPPGMPAHEPSNIAGATMAGENSVVPPAPSAGGAEMLASARGGGISGIGSQVAIPTPSIGGAEALGGDGRAAMNIRQSTPLPPPDFDEPANRTTREMPMRMISLALALPSSSFFSNYEVFIAERRVGKDVSQMIKLVYESRPNQRRISEYDPGATKVYKLRVTRDVTCDETALQMAGDRYQELQTSTKKQGLRLPQQDGILPCYRSTVDDYQRAIARGR